MVTTTCIQESGRRIILSQSSVGTEVELGGSGIEEDGNLISEEEAQRRM